VWVPLSEVQNFWTPTLGDKGLLSAKQPEGYKSGVRVKPIHFGCDRVTVLVRLTQSVPTSCPPCGMKLSGPTAGPAGIIGATTLRVGGAAKQVTKCHPSPLGGGVIPSLRPTPMGAVMWVPNFVDPQHEQFVVMWVQSVWVQCPR
jgi:hypothetical protein